MTSTTYIAALRRMDDFTLSHALQTCEREASAFRREVARVEELNDRTDGAHWRRLDACRAELDRTLSRLMALNEELERRQQAGPEEEPQTAETSGQPQSEEAEEIITAAALTESLDGPIHRFEIEAFRDMGDFIEILDDDTEADAFGLYARVQFPDGRLLARHVVDLESRQEAEELSLRLSAELIDIAEEA